MKKNKTVDQYIEGLEHWRPEIEKLRDILRSTELEETVKWGAPCYTYQGKNVVGLAAFKSYFGMWFHQGVFLDDPDAVLVNSQEGKTRGLRQWRFTSARDMKVRKIKSYVKEAIQLARDGRQIKPQRNQRIQIPSELKAALEKSKPAARAFDQLTPGKRREYAEYINEAKRDETKARRIKKILPMIRAGQGLNDKYR